MAELKSCDSVEERKKKVEILASIDNTKLRADFQAIGIDDIEQYFAEQAAIERKNEQDERELAELRAATSLEEAREIIARMTFDDPSLSEIRDKHLEET